MRTEEFVNRYIRGRGEGSSDEQMLSQSPAKRGMLNYHVPRRNLKLRRTKKVYRTTSKYRQRQRVVKYRSDNQFLLDYCVVTYKPTLRDNGNFLKGVNLGFITSNASVVFLILINIRKNWHSCFTCSELMCNVYT